MVVYIFGNRDLPGDNGAFKVAKKLGTDLKDVQFVEVKLNEDLPFDNGENVVIMDVVKGLDKVTLLDTSFWGPKGLQNPDSSPAKRDQDDEEVDSGRGQNDEVGKGSIVLPPRNSVHDFDLGFQLKYLKKLGKLGKVTIIGLPQSGNVDYDSIQSILRKLVAQDIQGS